MDLELKMNIDEVKDYRILEYISGSKLYGTDDEFSDTDIRGVFICPKKYLLNINKPQQLEDKKNDIVFHEIIRYFKLLTDNNPNIVETLFVPNEFILYKNKYWDKIVENKKLFISKKCRFTHLGYAFSQAKRIRSHRKFIMNPIKNQPQRSEFGLLEYSIIPKDQHSAILSISPDFVNQEFRDIVIKEKQYQNAMSEWNAYINWKKERNPKRRELEEKFKFDTKHASHLVRLIRLGQELLETGECHVNRPDAPELIAIKEGGYTYDEFESLIEGIEDHFDELYNKSSLPHSPDHKRINKLLYEILSDFYQINFEEGD